MAFLTTINARGLGRQYKDFSSVMFATHLDLVHLHITHCAS